MTLTKATALVTITALSRVITSCSLMSRMQILRHQLIGDAIEVRDDDVEPGPQGGPVFPQTLHDPLFPCGTIRTLGDRDDHEEQQDADDDQTRVHFPTSRKSIPQDRP